MERVGSMYEILRRLRLLRLCFVTFVLVRVEQTFVIVFFNRFYALERYIFAEFVMLSVHV